MLDSLFWFAGLLILLLSVIITISLLLSCVVEIIKNIYSKTKEYLVNEDSIDGP